MIGQLAILSAGLVLVVYALSGVLARFGFLADVVTDRSNHTQPVSRAGGILVIGVLVFAVGSLVMGGRIPVPSPIVYLALAMGILGAVDDIFTLKALPKLLVMLLVSIVACWLSGPVASIPVPIIGLVELPIWLAWPMTVVFVLGFVNAFNFMDGLNGMAASAGIVACVILVAIGASGDSVLILLAVMLAASLFGLAMRNVRHGSVFLGDAGSLLVGAFIAMTTAQAGNRDPVAFYVVLITFVPFLADTFITFCRRLMAGAPVLEPHKEHFYQRLRTVGWSHQAIALAYALMMSVGAAIGILVWQQGGAVAIWIGLAVELTVFVAVIRAMFRFGAARS